MPYAIDLSERQSSRTLEQAIRHEARVELSPRLWAGRAAILCRLAPTEMHTSSAFGQHCLFLKVEAEGGTAHGSRPGAPPGGQGSRHAVDEELIGVYCDGILTLSENRYLFSTEVVDVRRSPEGTLIQVSRPPAIQVAQRRRFWRFRPARSSQVDLRWGGDGHEAGNGVGWLCNISADGMACRTDTRVAERLWIGGRVSVRFKLEPRDMDWFHLLASLCNKTPAGTEGTVILGLQFQKSPEEPASAEAAERLRRRLLARCAAGHPAREGADA